MNSPAGPETDQTGRGMVILLFLSERSTAQFIEKDKNAEQIPGEKNKKVPVLTKIRDARFKRPIRPGETIQLQVRLVDRLSSVCILKGSAEVDGKLAVKTEFSCALVAL